MNREQAKEYISNNPQSYFKKANTSGFICPVCGNGTGSKGDGILLDPKDYTKTHYKCFSCDEYGDIIHFIGLEYGLLDSDSSKNTREDYENAFNKAYELYGIDIDNSGNSPAKDFNKIVKQPQNTQAAQNAQGTQEDINVIIDKQPEANYTDFFLKARKDLEKCDYLTQRGISQEVQEQFNIGYVEHWKHPKAPKAVPYTSRIIIPTGKGSYIARDTSPNANEDYKALKVGHSIPFNTKALYSGNPIFITEGEIDALSIMEAGAEAVALGSTANVRQLIDICKDKKPESPLIIALDNDKSGLEAEKKLTNGLTELGIFFLKANISNSYKDPNERLQKDRIEFINAVRKAQKEATSQTEAAQEAKKAEYMKNNTANHLQDFINGIASSVNTPYIPTGFKGLDRIFDGGLYEGLYIIGAISSLGKTTLILQIADQIAQQDTDILIFSLEMARAELMAKSISRLTFELCKDAAEAKTARGITTGKRWENYSTIEKELIKMSMGSYGEYAQNIYISEGMGDIGAAQIRETVEKHISITGKKPVVIIDYLQLLAPYDLRSTDKQNTDKAVLELKRISRDHKIPVIAISSFNRQNYNSTVSMEAFKESGAIEYSSDVLIGLQAKGAGGQNFDIDAAKNKDPREIELKILKNRNGATGRKLDFDYYPLFNCFKETESYSVSFDRSGNSSGYDLIKGENDEVTRATPHKKSKR